MKPNTPRVVKFKLKAFRKGLKVIALPQLVRECDSAVRGCPRFVQNAPALSAALRASSSAAEGSLPSFPGYRMSANSYGFLHPSITQNYVKRLLGFFSRLN